MNYLLSQYIFPWSHKVQCLRWIEKCIMLFSVILNKPFCQFVRVVFMKYGPNKLHQTMQSVCIQHPFYHVVYLFPSSTHDTTTAQNANNCNRMSSIETYTQHLPSYLHPVLRLIFSSSFSSSSSFFCVHFFSSCTGRGRCDCNRECATLLWCGRPAPRRGTSVQRQGWMASELGGVTLIVMHNLV